MAETPSFPCSSCTGVCCGTVPLSRARLDAILDYLKALPPAEQQRLADQKRSVLHCGFLDMETYQCSVYPVRPVVCKLYGSVPGMCCPKVGKLVQIVPEYIADDRMRREYTGGVIVLKSANFDWREVCQNQKKIS